MSILCRIPHSPWFHHPNTQLLKPTKIQSLASSCNRVFFFKRISIERVSTVEPVYAAAHSSPSLQPVEGIPPKLQEIIKLFQGVQEPTAKYEQLLFYGKNLKPLDFQYKTIENKVQGCVSQVWVRAYLDDNKNVIFEADSDSVLTKGLAALLVNGLSGRPAEEIVRLSPDFVKSLGLQQSLTPSRNNGFLNMLKLMQKKALQLYIGAEKADGATTELSGKKPAENLNLISNGDDGTSEVNLNEATSSVKNEFLSENVLKNLSEATSSVKNEFVSENVLKSRGKRIKEKLEKELNPVALQVEDVSYQHAGHSGVKGSDGETHFNVKVISKEFEGKSLIKRHRLIYSLLQDELQTGLHALSIEAKTPIEVDTVEV